MSKKPTIKYTNKSFSTIKDALVEHAQRFYPDRYTDFNESSFGSMMMDAVAYVGDMLSFYIDYQANENFLETALEYKNIRAMASSMGYKHQGLPSAYGVISIYISVPANASGLGPDSTYIPILKEQSEFASSNGSIFMLTEDVDFNKPTVEYVASQFNDATGKPTHYALRAFGRVKSGKKFISQIEVQDFEKFLRVRVGPDGINEIVSVFDSEGNEYYQVDYLSQDTIYKQVTNPNRLVDGVPSILKPFSAARRFVLEQEPDGSFLRFGYGSDEVTNNVDVSDPKSVVMKFSGRNYFTDYAFDPSVLLNTDKFGIAPSNTTLFVTYISNTSNNPNTPVGELNSVTNTVVDFNQNDVVDDITRGAIISSMEVTNDTPISVSSNIPTLEEMRYRAYASFAAQNRAVTKNDYESYCYQMPAKFGTIKRACVYNDPSGTNKRMALYVVSASPTNFLEKTNDTIKSNLKLWLQKNKMLADAIDVFDAKIINIAFDYQIVVDQSYDKLTVLKNVRDRLNEMFSEHLYIGEQIEITRIYNAINKIDGVIDTVKVTPLIRSGGRYSTINVSINDLLSADGKMLKPPKNVILELKYPADDLMGVTV